MFRSSLCLLLLFLSASMVFAQDETAKAPAHQNKVPVPIINSDLGGECSAEIRVTDVKDNPVYNAKVSVEIKYGFGGFHHTTLEVYTNTDGKARFEGLPRKSRGPYAFTANYQGRQTTVIDEPRDNCKGSFTAVLPNETVSEITGDDTGDE
jgi:hypothetical protein